MIIDLTQTLFDHMPVYPGDPEVIISHIHTLTKDGWNLRNMTFTTHTGTHVNAPIHMTHGGKTVSDIPIENFYGPCVLYSDGMIFDKNTGVIFTSINIDTNIADKLIKTPPKFIGLAEHFEFDIEIEKYLLEHDIVSYENLANTDKLPASFMFYGFPLHIKDSDGSPVRAIAIIE